MDVEGELSRWVEARSFSSERASEEKRTANEKPVSQQHQLSDISVLGRRRLSFVFLQ